MRDITNHRFGRLTAMHVAGRDSTVATGLSGGDALFALLCSAKGSDDAAKARHYQQKLSEVLGR